MQNTKFVNLLATLDKEEMLSFRKHLKQLHRNERIAIEVFEYILKFYPDFTDEKKFDLTYMSQKLFGPNGDSYRKQVLNALSELHSWLKRFLLAEKASDDSIESRLSWLLILQERQLEKEFSRQMTRIQQDMLDASLERNIDGYLKRMAVDYIARNSLAKNEMAQKVDTLYNFKTNLHLFYKVADLNVACELANLKNLDILQTPLETAIGDSAYLGEKHLLLRLYQEVYQLIALHREESYAKIEAMLIEDAQNIDRHEVTNVIGYLHNYASSQIRMGREEFWERVHQLNKLGIRHNVFAFKGQLPATHFTNIIGVACKMKDFVWADSFLAEQSIYLPEEIRYDTLHLAKAVILFEKKDFKQVIDLLEHKDFKNLNDNIRSRTLLLRSYYELGKDIDEMAMFCAAFEAFLRRNRKPSSEAVNATMNFLRIVKMLILEKNSNKSIMNAINASNSLYFRPWLVEKVTSYKAKMATKDRGK